MSILGYYDSCVIVGNVKDKSYNNFKKIRIDRTTLYGNPYVTPRDGDRDTVICLYKDWLHECYRKGNTAIVSGLASLTQRIYNGEQLMLTCHCKSLGEGLACHGDVLKNLLVYTASMVEADNRFGNRIPLQVFKGYVKLYLETLLLSKEK